MYVFQDWSAAHHGCVSSSFLYLLLYHFIHWTIPVRVKLVQEDHSRISNCMRFRSESVGAYLHTYRYGYGHARTLTITYTIMRESVCRMYACSTPCSYFEMTWTTRSYSLFSQAYKKSKVLELLKVLIPVEECVLESETNLTSIAPLHLQVNASVSLILAFRVWIPIEERAVESATSLIGSPRAGTRT